MTVCRYLTGATITLIMPLAVSAAYADTVVMRNGDRLSGQALHMSERTLSFSLSYAGTVQLPWAEIVSISTSTPDTLVLRNASGIRTGRLAPSEAGYLMLLPTDPDQVPRKIPLARVMYLNPTRSESGRGVEYKGHATLSASRVQGNSSGSNLNGEAELEARAKDYRYALRAIVNQATLAGSTVTSNWLLDSHVDRFVMDQKHFRYLRSSVQRDRFRDLRLRSAVGAGYGWQLIDNGITDLNVRGGLDLVSVNRYANRNQRYPALGWGLHFSQWLWQHRINVFHTEDGYWNIDHTTEITLRTRTGMRVPIAHGLMATTQLDLNWDRHPAPGVKPIDSTLLFGLGYQW